MRRPALVCDVCLNRTLSKALPAAEMQFVPRPLLIATVLLLSSATMAPAQEWAKKMFTTTSHDFGNVAQGR